MAKKEFSMNEIMADENTAVMPDQVVEDVIEPELQSEEEIPTGLIVERGSYVSNGKRYLNYLINGTIKGKSMKSELAPMDPGSYDLLNLMYDGVTGVELYRVPFKVKDDKGKVTFSGERYYVIVDDEVMGRTRVRLKPKRDSDKNILEIFMRLAARAAQGE